uniref:non-specific serine/threonine protein kinase n=1 Tax=Monodon monoceros TaxID=40151 RepID=A0A8C6BM18_MONMO
MMEGLTANSADKEAHIDDYEILHTIGEGTFAKVKLARHILTGTQVAVKVIKKRRQSLSTFQERFREVRNMKALNHPNIVKLLGVIDTEETLFLVMEYLSGGDMFSYLVNHGRMTEAEARGPFQQLVSALQHCHQRGIVHRDLKPPNLLFDSNMNLKLTDFGRSGRRAPWDPVQWKMSVFSARPSEALYPRPWPAQRMVRSSPGDRKRGHHGCRSAPQSPPG